MLEKLGFFEPVTCVHLARRIGSVALWLVLLCGVGPQAIRAQTNTFPVTGDVGIGTTSPGASLQVKGSGVVVGATYEDGDTTSYGLNIETNQAAGNYAYLGIARMGNAGMYLTQISSQFTIGPNENGSSPFLTINNASSNIGSVGIGTTDPCTNSQAPSNCKLSVAGAIQAQEVVVNTGWSDYVFNPDYRLTPLTEVAGYIQQNHHLPGIPSEAEVKDKGVSLGDMQSKLLAKIEELTLRMIQADERNSRLEQENGEMRREIQEIKEKIAQ